MLRFFPEFTSAAFLQDPSYKGYIAVHKPAFPEWLVNFPCVSKGLLGRFRAVALSSVRRRLAHKLLIELLHFIRFGRRDTRAGPATVRTGRSRLNVFAADNGG